MNKKKHYSIMICVIFTFVFMIAGIILAVLSNRQVGFNLYNILSLICIFIAACFIFIPMIVNKIHSKRLCQQLMTQRTSHPTQFIDAIFKDYMEHNLQFSIQHIEKQYFEPLMNEKNELAVRYHTLFVYQKIDIYIEIYFLMDRCVILFDDGKLYQKEMNYDNQTNTQDFYYQISLIVNAQLEEIIKQQKVSKG